MDVIHRGNDNYQDRYDFVARAGNDPGNLGEYLESPVLLCSRTVRSPAQTTESKWAERLAAGHFENIDVTNPVHAGVSVLGQSSITTDGISVSGGGYGALISQAASGSVDFLNVDFQNQGNAGVYYLNDIGGDFSGTIAGSSGAALQVRRRNR